jgi:CHAT domain-containing protein
MAAGLVGTLTAPATVERDLAGGEAHAWIVEAQAGHPLLVTVDQRGIDVEIDVHAADAADGKSLGIVDTPTGREGPESVLIEGVGSWRVEVRSPSTAARAGRYELRLEELPMDAPAGRERVEAERLMTAGARLRKQGTAEAARQAMARFTEAAVHWRALGRRREEATALYLLAGLQSSLGDPRQALETCRQALPILESIGRTDLQARALSLLGLAQRSLGKDAEALALFERALALQRARGDRSGEAGALNNICLIRHSKGELQEALSCYERVLGIFRETGEAAGQAVVLTNLGGVYELLGEPRKALDDHGRALDLRVSLGDRRGEAQTLNNLGVTFGAIGEQGEALSRLDRALAIFRELGDREWQARTLHNLGSAYARLGEWQRARASFEQALALRRAVGDRRGEAVTLNFLGFIQLRLGETAAALDLYRQALDLGRAVGDRRGEANTLSLMGQARMSEGAVGDLDPALESLGKATVILRDLGDRLALAVALQRTGEIYQRRGDLARASQLFGEALGLRRAITDRNGEAETLTALARVEAASGHLPEARAHVEQALALIESLRTLVVNPDLRASFLGSNRQAYEVEIDLLMQLARRDPGGPAGTAAREALERSEYARARALLDLLREARADIRQGSDPALRDRERDLTERLNAKAQLQIERLSGAGAGEARAAGESEMQALLTELDAVRAEIRSRSPRYAALTQPSPLRVSEIQALLGPDTLLLEYSLGEERSFLWAVDAGSVTSFSLPPRAEIETASRRVWERMRTLDAGTAKEGDQEAAALSRMLLGPVAGLLAGRRLAIVADGALQYLPWGALPEPAGTDLLIDGHEIVSLPSASVLATQRRDLGGRAPAPRVLAVLADPVFDAGDPRVTRAGQPAAPSAQKERGLGSFPAFPRLPSTRQEAERIASLVPADQELVALDFRAGREAVVRGELAPYRIVHFATHGVIDARTPEVSGLVLSLVGEDGKPREGFLSLADIYNLELGADLVVLSGCETALGREIRGEGLVGLTQGFLYAGAARVVASLWRVQDRATAELMGRFYRSMLQDGKPPAAALREAQLAIRHERRWRDPYYWAAFVLQGDWR